MIPIDQTILNKTRGNCIQAVVASMFELELTQVPNFVLFGKGYWNMLYYFICGLGYQIGCRDIKFFPFSHSDMVNGCIMAFVKSKTYKHVTHAILINDLGRVIHDPNPKKQYQDVDVLKTGELVQWIHMKDRRKKINVSAQEHDKAVLKKCRKISFEEIRGENK